MTIPDNHVSAIVLGTMQDGGLPHAGCRCARCTAAFQDPRAAQYAACLALVDKRRKPALVWLIDATPDIKWQLNLLAGELGEHPQRVNRVRQPDGIFLTHAHMGHIGGLSQLGPEAMAVEQLPLFAAQGLDSLLQSTRLWRPAISCFVMNPLVIGEAVALASDLSITPVAVPHRDEWGVGTVAYLIHGPQQSLLYLPDIDSWDQWAEGESTLLGVNFALVDGSFYSVDELGGREPIAHPLVQDTLNRFADLPCQLVLTHFNHTNPVLDKHGPEEEYVRKTGAVVAKQGMIFYL